jgi:hypothetical protein
VNVDAGREDIYARMEDEELRPKRIDDVEKYIKAAICKLEKALPIADARKKPFIIMASEALHEAMK